jgi:2-oxoglutarate-Fe(II)-dependent oxygenase superfamily protein
MLQLGVNNIALPSDAEISTWRRQFADARCIHVRGFVDARLLTWLRERLARARFQERVHRDLVPPAVDLGLADERLLAMIATLVNDRRLFGAVRAISGCDPIGCYNGIVYRMDPRPDHRDTWHSDMDGNRMVTLSVNLGEPYEGGILQIRQRPSLRVVHEVANTGPGDAILFALGEDLEHRVGAVTGRSTKMALAGWFQRTPPALETLRFASAGAGGR